MKIIGLTGPAGCGKDTVARFLCETQGFVQIALADPIRAGILAMFGLDPKVFSDRDLKEAPINWLGRSPRQLLQTLGTEWGRTHVADDLWMRVAEQRITKYRQHADSLHIEGVVISDIRFNNEAEWLRLQGGDLWHIERPGEQRQAVAAHVSESGVFRQLGEVVLHNDGTLDELFELVAATLIESEKDPKPVEGQITGSQPSVPRLASSMSEGLAVAPAAAVKESLTVAPAADDRNRDLQDEIDRRGLIIEAQEADIAAKLQRIQALEAELAYLRGVVADQANKIRTGETPPHAAHDERCNGVAA